MTSSTSATVSVWYKAAEVAIRECRSEVLTLVFDSAASAFVKAPEKYTKWYACSQQRDQGDYGFDGPSHGGR